ncbi:Flp family type IVb pilin [Acidisphaera rubrifaciens]|uniref:Pilus component Flp/Fap n=1 Tax=Acidisphaera rubrifaciens HS-AP3 TaxID=1231350 RepID=A0A0D6PC57_9PROT|nr:Flp family type IVb pilin [Acidisphaera rubrifaciens]GAN78444.1 pilus component Flp/Fap [Acidisphaera rubrifaciens HS-AP3]
MRVRPRVMLSDRRGVTALEYGLIAALIALVLVAALTSVGGGLNHTFNQISNTL